MSQQDINKLMGHDSFIVGEHLIKQCKFSSNSNINRENFENLLRQKFRFSYRKHIISKRKGSYHA